MPAKYALTAGRVLHVAIFLLGGASALSGKAGDWGWAAVYAVLAIVCYFLLQMEVVMDMEDDDQT